MIVALPVLLLGGLFVHYSAIRPFDRAAGGNDVAFAAPPSPTAAPGAAPRRPRRRTPLKVTVVGDSMAHALVINRPKALASTIKVSDGAIDGLRRVRQRFGGELHRVHARARTVPGMGDTLGEVGRRATAPTWRWS